MYDSLTLATPKAGDKPEDAMACIPGSSEISVNEGKPHTRWFSSTVIHYTGNGLWTIGLAPLPLRSNNRWEWVASLDAEHARELLVVNQNRIVRCDTEEVRRILRGA